MTDEETEFDDEIREKRPRQVRKRNEVRRVFIHRMIDGKPNEQGSFPETAIGTPLERRLPTFIKELFGNGEFKAEVRKPNGHFERSFDCSIAETERQDVIEVEPEIEEIEDEFEFQDNENLNALQLKLLIEKEKTNRLEKELQSVKTGSQNETQTLISALESARAEQRELMMLLLSQASRPQQDATTQAMNILEKSLGIVTKAKMISEEIAPQETPANESFLGGAAKFVDSIGRNAGTFLPLLGGLGKPIVSASRQQPTPAATDGNEQSGELSDLLSKVKTKKEQEQ